MFRLRPPPHPTANTHRNPPISHRPTSMLAPTPLAEPTPSNTTFVSSAPPLRLQTPPPPTLHPSAQSTMKSTTLVLALAVFFLGTCSARRIGGSESDLGAGLRHEAGAKSFKLNEIPNQFYQDLELKTHR